MAKVHSMETLRAQRRQQTVNTTISFLLDGKQHDVTKEIANGELTTYDLAAPIGEMMTSENSRKELLQKVVLDVELGREEVPLLYSPIYERIVNEDFPREFTAKWAQRGIVVFAEHIEGQEVRFGSLRAEEGPIVRIRGYTAGFQYTKELQMFNETFNFELLNKAFGEAHHRLLNHLHLGPIITHQYKPANKTGPVYVKADGTRQTAVEGAHYLLSLRETIKQGLTDCRTAKRPASVLLANPADQEDLTDALSSMTVGGTPLRALDGIRDIIYYEGTDPEDLSVGKKKDEKGYPAVPAGKAYLIRPKRGFKELIKQELQIQATIGDITRLVESDVVGDFWRAVFAAVEENVQEITLPGKS